ncbi:hypothetical protein [Nocardia sp. BMG51109]|uniref:hypothetical protein n=1 Tax=Nocardia sp. BMG51109 TaxID=1056816 RepID=UPI000463E794|nr:hypothetical protein [Nocardia sp. BMG51109]
MFRKISVAVSVAASMAALAGGMSTAAPVDPAAGPVRTQAGCTPFYWADPDTAPVKQLHVRVDGCGNLAGRNAKIVLTNDSEVDCKPLDAGNHASWHIVASADYKNLVWC